MRRTSDIIKTVDTISVQANGIEFEVDTQGDGEKLVLCLHGWPEHSITWRYQMPFLANLGYKVWAPNLRGYGNSDVPKGIKNYQIEVLMNTYLKKTLNIDKWLVFGGSWGSTLALAYSQSHPDSVTEIIDPKVEIIKTDFNNLQNHMEDVKGDDCFFCIGTTKQNSSDKDEYKRVELDIPKEIAKIAKSNLVNSFIFVSALYANPKSSGEYIRFKGLVEEELKELNFPKLGIMRPSFLIGNRKEKRASETIGIFVFKLLSPLLLGPLKKMKPIHSETVAKAMIKISRSENDQIIFESNEIVKLSIS